MPRCGRARAISIRCACSIRSKRLDPAMFTKSGMMVGLGEEQGRGAAGDGRSARGEGRFPHHRAISPADAEASRDRPLRHARGVRELSPPGVRQGLSDGLGLAADALLLSRRRGFRPAQGGARRLARRRVVLRCRPMPSSACFPTRRSSSSIWSPMSSATPNSCRGASARASASARLDLIVADLMIGFRMFRERFTSRVALDPPRRIDVTYTEGPFRYLNNHWVFEQGPAAAASISLSISSSSRGYCSASSSCCSTRRCGAWSAPSRAARGSSTAPRRPIRRANRRYSPLFRCDPSLLLGDQALDHAPHMHPVGVGGDVDEPLLAEFVEPRLLRLDHGFVLEKRRRDLAVELLGRLGLVLPVAVRGRPEIKAARSRSPGSGHGTAGTGSGNRAADRRRRCRRRSRRSIAGRSTARQTRIAGGGRRGP